MTGINLPKRNLRHVNEESDMSKRKRKQNNYELTEYDIKRGVKQNSLFNLDDYRKPVGWVTEDNVVKMEGK